MKKSKEEKMKKKKNKPKWENYLRRKLDKLQRLYCTCGAAQGVIEGNYHCIKGCMGKELVDTIRSLLKQQRKELLEEAHQVKGHWSNSKKRKTLENFLKRLQQKLE